MSWELDLQALERAIAVVNAEYDAFLYGSAARPPIDSRKNVDRLIRILGRGDPDNAADRYRFSTIQERWNTLIERWERLQGEKEAGKRPGLYGRFNPQHVQSGDRGAAPPAAPRAVAPNAAAPAPNAGAPASVEPKTSPSSDARRELFEKYLAARKVRGESSAGLNFERFANSLARETERVRERFGGADVEFDVAERDGKVKLVARRKTE
ncbi:MAG: MXAN_5187 C-terminal domain-containing protein [Acidobacteriota bacterium]